MANDFTPSQVAAAATSGVPVRAIIGANGRLLLECAMFGDILYRIVPRSDVALTLGRGHKAQKQSVGLVLQQPPEGGCEVTWPPEVRWLTGAAPFADSRPGAITLVTFTRLDDSALVFGRVGL